jgi:hypothetical protein
MISSIQTSFHKLLQPGLKRFLIFIPLVILPLYFLTSCQLIRVLTSEDDCSKPYIDYEQQVNITPLVNLKIPADMDLSRWADSLANNTMDSTSGIRVKISRNPDIEITRMDFDRVCSLTLGPRDVGESGNTQYCISKVIEDQADPEGGCAPLGYYRSFVILQKETVLIEIYEDSKDKASQQDGRAKDVVIQQLADEIASLASTGNYPLFYPGKYLYDMYCYDCHSIDGSNSKGSTWKGLYGRQTVAEDGSTIIVDDAYISYAILHHQDNPRMKNVARWITDQQIQDIIIFIKTLTTP